MHELPSHTPCTLLFYCASVRDIYSNGARVRSKMIFLYPKVYLLRNAVVPAVFIEIKA